MPLACAKGEIGKESGEDGSDDCGNCGCNVNGTIGYAERV